MGQMTYAVMLAVDAGEAPESLEDGWFSLLERFKAGSGPEPTCPCGDSDKHDLIGFWIAVGASGREGVPDLTSAPLDDFLDVPDYRSAHARATKAWKKFGAWCKKQGFDFGEPRLWLVLTEVG